MSLETTKPLWPKFRGGLHTHRFEFVSIMDNTWHCWCSLCPVVARAQKSINTELSFAAMEEDGLAEVSFTGLAIKALGSHFGAFVAVIYASLIFLC